ncbi:MAG: hypothetical protein A3C71_02090 [Candidatus Yanofskybacteria bacterium RIFCSPHIGHO2_02_FULL_43_15c]|uniref:DUF4325 domain-containing protein n=2 Tax=Candidatus Yanofskyibacteriota TaxID=1752733 RepID=A0A1F8H593_9BACT|nr:MAG: hypothetical protein A3C71_02090 [Candidatus Yanofskybacteria bacterium RIFCSPHIGHO2_02_FULL_43_15c]OGN32774.1 MAG: hypothetical protein A3I92_01530 [Candidatus Yanofskybacteria bacterium RIFCSPLOWO2_02_FULL_43_10b]
MGVKDKIKSLIEEKKIITAIQLARFLGVTRQYASRLLKILVNSDELIKSGSTRSSRYTLPKYFDELGTVKIARRIINKEVKEHEVMEQMFSGFPAIMMAPEHIQGILRYAFSEMLNNAVEHSRSDIIEIEMIQEGKILRFAINDFGIGVFKNVMKQRHLANELEAMQDLLKGKTTTAPKAHSGEGIFFTSKVADRFVLESFGHRLLIDNTIPDVFFQEQKPSKNGTRVIFSITSNSRRHISDVFNKFQAEPGSFAFDKTEIRVRLFTMGTIHISRSQARRILTGLNKFKLIILDFKDVPNIGQAFADEVFRVFKNKHPDIKIETINANESVRFMIERVALS